MSFPTRSGILGLICCALGAGGEQRELLAEFSPLGQTVLSFVRTKEREGEVHILDSEPLLCDFQMVGNGYDDRDPWENLLVPKKNDGGKPAVVGGAKMIYRYYLQDAAFAVVLEMPKSKSSLIAEAMQNPEWDLYLGRKNCVPTDLIYRGIFAKEPDAIQKALEIGSEKNRRENFRVVTVSESEDFSEGELLVLNDAPVQFGSIKRYHSRQVRVIHVQ